MPDVFGRIVTFLFGTVLLFMVPLTLIMLKQDDTKQALWDDAVVEFVDNARASGEITPASYIELTQKIDAAHQGCDLKITYEASRQTPDPIYKKKADGTNELGPDGKPIITGYTYKRSLEAYTKEDITDYMYYKTDNFGRVIRDASGRKIENDPAIDFPLKEGGYLTVQAKNKKPTPGTQMLRMFIPGYNGKTLVSSYSGYVGNNKQ